MVTSSNVQEAILVGCDPNPEKIYKLRWSNGITLEWELMKQKLQYPRSNVVAMFIPDALTHCRTTPSTTSTTLQTTPTTVTPIILNTTTTLITTSTTTTPPITDSK